MIKVKGFILAATVALFTGCADSNPVPAESALVPPSLPVTFKWFDYTGHDAVFSNPLGPNEYRNPIVAGFYPDPSITRAGDSYYMVHSSFSYFPGIPLLRSNDLVHWQPLGHVLTRSSQLKNLDGAGVSRGIFAPTIRYHDGVFYVITTGVDGAGGNFIVTAKDPAGEWSDPYYLPEIDGIDPSLFFNDDGKVYVTHNGPPLEPPLYEGHRAIWKWELDLETLQIIPDTGKVIVNGGADITKKPIWIEGPHLYKVNGWYYLLCAEGGTAENHSEVVFRARSLNEPFVPYEHNPILSQRHLDPTRVNPVATAGHVDMVQTPNGDWWAVFLATRNYQQDYFNTGRETFLMPVQWNDEWPVIAGGTEALPYTAPAPKGLAVTKNAQPLNGNFTVTERFSGPSLNWQWNTLRSGDSEWYSFLPEGGLQLKPSGVQLADLKQPAFVGRRQQHQSFTARTELQLPVPAEHQAGITVFQSEQAHVLLAVEHQQLEQQLVLYHQDKSGLKRLATHPLTEANRDKLTLIVEGDEQAYRFAYQWGEQAPIEWLEVSVDVRDLSTQRAGGFVGVYVGLFARTLDE